MQDQNITIKNLLISKTRKLKESTLNNYLVNLEKLNNYKKIKHLKFLNNPSDILNKIQKYGLHTQKTYIIPILTILKCQINSIQQSKTQDKQRYLYFEYCDILESINKKMKSNKKI